LDFPVIINLLYSTGMRISEVLNLTIKDFDLNTGIIYVNKSKFNKSRLIPISNSLKSLCINHLKMVHLLSKEDDFIFSNIYHKKYTTDAIYVNFKKLLKLCTIVHTGNGPRLHDLSNTHLNKIRTFLKDEAVSYISEPKRFGLLTHDLSGRTPHRSASDLPLAFHFLETDLSLSSSNVASACASCSVVMSR